MEGHETPLPEPAHPIVDGHTRRRGLFFVGLAVAFVGFTLAMQMGLNANFLAGELGISPFQMGVIESARESCGIYALGILALLSGVAEPLVGLGMLVLVAAGISGYAGVHAFGPLVALSMVWSTGLHVWMPLPNSITLALSEPHRAGHRMGQVQSAGAAGFGIGLLTALILALAKVQMRPMYLFAGVAAVLGALMCLGIPRRIKTPGPRLVFHRRYALYYVLCVLEGWRKQIFICFAGFLLVKIYNTPLEMLLWLWMAIQAIGYYASPAVGKLIDRIGERRVLVFYYLCLTTFFVGYAFIKNQWVLYGIFVLDSAFFVFAMSLNTYVNRIAPRNELTPTLSMGVAMNHVAAVAMPFIGGLLWKTFSYEWTFLAGALAALLSVPVTLRIPKHHPPDGRKSEVRNSEPETNPKPESGE
jgi:predicted MFS family arabinose efflux permease